MSSIPTVQSLVRTSRRLNHLNRKVEHVVELMRAGASLRCTHRSSSTQWTLSSGFEVNASVANLVINRTDIVGVGDSLFGAELSQTFRHIEN
jgi:hypothetical protein